MTTLALDLGTKTGWALCDQGVLRAGTWKLATDAVLRKARKEGPFDLRDRDPRASELLRLLRAVQPVVQRVVWEDVQFSSSTAQTQLWATFRGVLWAFLADHPTIHAVPVPVGTLKKFATGSGNADKNEMKEALVAGVKVARVGLSTPVSELDDNAIDAVWLAHYAETLYGSKI